jgi:hypothetical protein
MSRPREFHENMTARFTDGTFRRIALVIEGHETRTDFVRIAVEHEIERRFDELRDRERRA